MSTGCDSPSAKQRPSALKAAKASALVEQRQAYFSELDNPCVESSRAHLLVDILSIRILCVIAGGKGWEDMETYALSKQEWLKQFLALTNGIPCPDTFRCVFERINPEQFEQCFRGWIQALVATVGVQVIPIDGKSLKGSYDREQKQSALHVVSAQVL